MLFSLLPSRIQSSPLYRYTGCFRVNDIMFLLISQAIKHLNKLDRSYISTESIAFWCMISKKCHNYSVVIHLWRLRRCIIEEIWKTHWKSTIKKRQYCFANISATKALIFMIPKIDFLFSPIKESRNINFKLLSLEYLDMCLSLFRSQEYIVYKKCFPKPSPHHHTRLWCDS